MADAAEHRPRGVTAAYDVIGVNLRRFRCDRIQGSVQGRSRMTWANLITALLAPKALPWFPEVVRDISRFKIKDAMWLVSCAPRIAG